MSDSGKNERSYIAVDPYMDDVAFSSGEVLVEGRSVSSVRTVSDMLEGSDYHVLVADNIIEDENHAQLYEKKSPLDAGRDFWSFLKDLF